MSAEKRRVEKALREFRAMGLLTAALDPESRDVIEDAIRRLPDMHKTELLWHEAQAVEKAERLRTDFGAKLPSAEYAKIIQEAEKSRFAMFWIPKHYIEEQWFANAGRISTDWNRFPPHTRFGIDAKGLARSVRHSREWRLLEATLFEDLAMLWNDAYGSRADDTGRFGDDKIPGKRHREQVRSTIRAAFALVEGYLNGIAHDIAITRDIQALSQRSREAVLERDDSGLPRFKPLKAKVITYPRLALGLTHSPLDEGNCPELEFLLAKERELRDAVMHPAPRIELDRPLLREQAFYDVEFEVLDQTVANAIGLIRRIDRELNGMFGTVEIWLRDRGADNLFPRETFH